MQNANSVTKVEDIRDAADFNRFVTQVSSAMAQKALDDNDTAYFEAVRIDTVAVYDVSIAILEHRYDYDAWLAAMIKCNEESKIFELDTTGQLNKALELMASVHTIEFYNTHVLPMFDTITVADITAQKNLLLDTLDQQIKSMREEAGNN